jgi:succinate dehydrogenase (ubiquinone) cytochrome b560 subunit
VGDITLLGPLTKVAVAFPLTFHYLGGVRHLIWDKSPELLQNDQVEKTSYALFGASAALSLVIAAL